MTEINKIRFLNIVLSVSFIAITAYNWHLLTAKGSYFPKASFITPILAGGCATVALFSKDFIEQFDESTGYYSPLSMKIKIGWGISLLLGVLNTALMDGSIG